MPSQPLFFIESLGVLYEDVQNSRIFADSKFFVDCVPKYPAEKILGEYLEQKRENNFDLKKFVEEHFSYPAETNSGYESANKPIDKHLQDLWDILKREPSDEKSTLINLPYSYIVPGGRFREIYYWDSYFTALGLQVSKRVDIMQNMVDNFAFLINEVGFIPNGNRTYYLGRSQPPFFALFVQLLAEEKGKETLLRYRNELEKEYMFWMTGEDKVSAMETSYQHLVHLQDGTMMNRYYDKNKGPRPEAYIEDIHIAKQSSKETNITYTHIRSAAESGWDFSTRWFADGKNMSTIETTDLIPVDLNCILLHLEETLSEIYSLSGDEKLQKLFREKISIRKKAIINYCWNEEYGFYFDYNHVTKTHTGKYTLAAAYPLFFGIASKEQAEKVAAIIEEKFLHAGGLVTTIYKSGQQWDSPNGWAPLQWIAYKGLKRYGLNELAKKLKANWVKNCEAVYESTGKMMEKYNVVDTSTSAGGGEYPNQDGFGWTNGVYLKMKSEED